MSERNRNEDPRIDVVVPGYGGGEVIITGVNPIPAGSEIIHEDAPIDEEQDYNDPELDAGLLDPENPNFDHSLRKHKPQ